MQRASQLIRNRRSFLQASVSSLAGLATLPLAGGLLAGCQSAGSVQTAGTRGAAGAAPRTTSARVAPLTSAQLTDRISVISGAPGNVVALNASDGIVLVDSGSAALAKAVRASLGGGRVTTLFNTHYHSDQTGGNELYGSSGATIHAHVITREWLATDYYVPADDRWVKALPPKARPTATFRDKGELQAGADTIEFGYLIEAHTRGDIYVLFKEANVLAVGDVASPERDPMLDWYAGAWLGGRVDAMTALLALANDQTKIVPAYGPVMTRAQLQAERDMMQTLYDKTTALTTQGRSAQDMIDAGVIKEVNRQFQDPYRFFYDVSKGLWAHYTNFGGNIV